MESALNTVATIIRKHLAANQVCTNKPKMIDAWNLWQPSCTEIFYLLAKSYSVGCQMIN